MDCFGTIFIFWHIECDVYKMKQGYASIKVKLTSTSGSVLPLGTIVYYEYDESIGDKHSNMKIKIYTIPDMTLVWLTWEYQNELEVNLTPMDTRLLRLLCD